MFRLVRNVLVVCILAALAAGGIVVCTSPDPLYCFQELVTFPRYHRYDALIRQVTGAVRWVDCVQSLIAAGATCFVEVGPGKVLCGLLKQIDPAQKSLNVEDQASLEATLAALG